MSDDWRIREDTEFLINSEIDPTDSEELAQHRPNLRRCVFCLDEVNPRESQRWYVPADKSCCICERCFAELRGRFSWRLLDGWDIEW